MVPTVVSGMNGYKTSLFNVARIIQFIPGILMEELDSIGNTFEFCDNLITEIRYVDDTTLM